MLDITSTNSVLSIASVMMLNTIQDCLSWRTLNYLWDPWLNTALHLWISFHFPCHCAMMNRRPYSKSVANWGLKNKPKPLAELMLFPLELSWPTGGRGYRKWVLCFNQACVWGRWLGQAKEWPKENVVYFGIFLYWIYYERHSRSTAVNKLFTLTV